MACSGTPLPLPALAWGREAGVLRLGFLPLEGPKKFGGREGHSGYSLDGCRLGYYRFPNGEVA
jgi:hypothetical protein